MTVVDSSAAVATITGEADAHAIDIALDRAQGAVMSAATLVELGIVLENRVGAAAQGLIDQFLRNTRVEVVPVERSHADRALEGWRRFGKGRHPAALNFGDCFTYALAATMNLPVLCTGNDFARTDVQVVPLGD